MWLDAFINILHLEKIWFALKHKLCNPSISTLQLKISYIIVKLNNNWLIVICIGTKMLNKNVFDRIMHSDICTSYPKVMAMIVMRKPKKASSFLRPAEKEMRMLFKKLLLQFTVFLKWCLTEYDHNLPYLSKKRKTNVSMMVMRTPPHKGILSVNTHTHTVKIINTREVIEPF